MYEKSSQANCPPDETVICRYFNLKKLTSLFEEQALYFCRIDRFEDPFEGSYPRAGLQLRERLVKNSEFKEVLEQAIESGKSLRTRSYANCWHQNTEECDLMCNKYFPDNNGVILYTTIKSLKNCFKDTKERISITQIKYIDYKKTILIQNLTNLNTGETQTIPDLGGHLRSLFLKQKRYKAEREIRCVYLSNENERICKDIPGIYIKVDLNCLIEELHFAPNVNNQFKEDVRNIIKKNKCNFKVLFSEKEEKPVF